LSDTGVAAVIFVITYVIIVSERVHKTAAALAGAVIMIAFRVLNQEEAFAAIDLNVIFLLAGMMMIVNVLGKTGIFQWVAIRSARLGQGQPLRILIILALVTAVASAFLDNVTTVVLIAPVTVFVAGSLGVSAVPFLIAEALASNIGGTATLIGDPPNILIASGPANLNFNDFLLNVAPIILVILAFYVLSARFLFFRGVNVDEDARARVMAMDEREVITDPKLLRISLIVLGLTLVGFVAHGPLGYEPATVALLGAAALLVVTREDPHDILQDVEWSTLFFFVGLFIVVGGVDKVGILEHVGKWASDVTAGSRTAATMLLLWMSAFLSGIVDNIPYSTAMIPVVEEINKDLGGGHANNSLWWALALGADLGGNLTVIAASANVIVANLAERGGQRIPFWEFFRYGLVVTTGSMLLSTAYLWLRYLL
jgi:Na+/H+ antiporter NhaD/arsenite permease-like protein